MSGKDMEKRTALFKTMAEETNKVMTKTMDETLKPDQIKRLKQINGRSTARATLASNEEVQKALKLTRKPDR